MTKEMAIKENITNGFIVLHNSDNIIKIKIYFFYTFNLSVYTKLEFNKSP